MDGFLTDGAYQCATCDNFFEEPTIMGNCPNCGSGNWVRGCIDEPEPDEDSEFTYDEWARDARDGDTELGYDDWVKHRRAFYKANPQYPHIPLNPNIF